MPETPDRTGASWDALVATPLEAVRLLRREPLLLAAIAGAAVLALVALFGPDGGQVYAAIIAGLIVVCAVLWAVLRPAERRAAGRSGPSNRLRWGRRTTLQDVDVAARQDNDVRMGGGATVRNTRFVAGEVPPPRQAPVEQPPVPGTPG